MWKLPKSLQREVLTILPCGIANFVFGNGFGWVAPALAYLTSDDSDVTISEDELSWIVSIYFASEVISAIVAGIFMNKIGRTPLMSFAIFMLAFSWLIMIFANTAYTIILSRVILGVAAGLFNITWSVYVGEVTSPKNRGVFGSIMISLVIGGEMIEFLLSLLVPYVYLSIIPFALAVVAFVTSFSMEEAPQFALMHNDEVRAKKSLAWLRGDDDDGLTINTEFVEMKQYIEDEKCTDRSFKQFLQSPSEYSVYIICVLTFSLAQLSGNIILLSFQPLIMEKYNDIPTGDYLTFIYGVLQFSFVNLSTCLIESLGRRILLIVGFAAATILQFAITYLFYLDDTDSFGSTYVAKAVLVLFNVYGVIFIVCILPAVYVLKSELFPQELKAIGSVSTTVCNAFAEFVVMKLFVLVWDGFGLHINFGFYAVVSLISVIYVYTLIPETKGKSLAQIQKNIALANAQRKRSTVTSIDNTGTS